MIPLALIELVNYETKKYKLSRCLYSYFSTNIFDLYLKKNTLSNIYFPNCDAIKHLNDPVSLSNKFLGFKIRLRKEI